MKQFLIFAFIAFLVNTPTYAEEHGAKPAAEEAPPPSPMQLAIPDNYCANVADKARDARYFLQAESLKQLQQKLQDETAKLEQKRVEVEALIKQRDDEMKKARRELVDIYAKVKPDIAAVQLAMLPPETAASVIRQLKPQGASVIMNEMKPEVAAAIAVLLAAQPAGEANDGSKDQGS